jgi:hypothetical protein
MLVRGPNVQYHHTNTVYVLYIRCTHSPACMCQTYSITIQTQCMYCTFGVLTHRRACGRSRCSGARGGCDRSLPPLRNVRVKLRNASLVLRNVSVKLRNVGINLTNVGVKLRNVRVKLRTVRVKLRTVRVKLRNVHILPHWRRRASRQPSPASWPRKEKSQFRTEKCQLSLELRNVS